MIRLNRWWYALVGVVLAAAFFIDTYSLTYRFGVEHKSLGAQLNANPHIGGLDLFVRKGLDIQGGTELTIGICQGPNNPAGTACRSGLPGGVSLDQAQRDTINVLGQRVNKLGVSEATVQAQGSDRVLVQLPGVSQDQAQNVLGTTAKLRFASAVPNPNGPDGQPLSGPALATDPQVLRDQEGQIDPAQLSQSQFYPQGFHWKIDDSLKASNVTNADVSTTTGGAPAVTINFDSDGANEWQKLTTAAAGQQPGSPQNLVAIFLDNKVLTAPQVKEPSSSSTQISGGSLTDVGAAQQLATQISSGALPADIVTLQSNSVSATLGQDAVRRSLIAGAVGMIVVIVFMIGYYRFPGILASLALICYAAIVLALYKLLGVTVSLAGLAGFVLSVGMAVDANVLIFERTRDELRHGRGVGPAVEAGFRRAWPAIRDSNISTMIACIVLYEFGSSVVKGFALTLFVGVAVSMFSAILVTQSLLTGVLRWRFARSPRLYTELRPELSPGAAAEETAAEEVAAARPRGRFDIVRSRNLWFAGSLLVIIPGLVAILAWGFRLGLDFAGGYVVDVTLSHQATQSQVQSTVESVQLPTGGVASSLQPQVQSEGGNQFSIRTLSTNPDNINAVVDSLQRTYGVSSRNREDQVGPTIASELVRNAVILVVLASALIAVYLALVFRTQAISRWRFSVCTFLKLLHDVFVLVGIWAIIGHFSTLGQIDSLFVTALLTSIAFSIHDTIVVFDRIRENLRTGPRLTFQQTINLSTMQTMTRSLNTALTVAFVLLALVLFGGDSIRGFVLALLIGIVTGTYSSIFNASTLLVAWQSLDRERPAPTRQRPQRRVQARPAG